MTGKQMVPWGTAIVGDMLSALQIPGSGFVGKLGDRYLERKQKEAAEILIEEVAKGSPEPINFAEVDVDPLIEITYRFSKAVADGAARENLRLLAQIIAGLKRNKALEPDKFRRWANILEQLTRDELIVIGKAISIQRKIAADGGAVRPEDFCNRLKSELLASGYQSPTIDPLCMSLVRTTFASCWTSFGGGIAWPRRPAADTPTNPLEQARSQRGQKIDLSYLSQIDGSAEDDVKHRTYCS